MPLITNPAFDSSNAQLLKRPLYMLFIDGIAEPLTSFRYCDVNVTPSGYGLDGYGFSGYGY
jgi:hypothetical protein